MRLVTSASIGVLSLLLGIPAISAQEEKPRQEEAKPQATKPQEERPAQQNKEMKPEQNHPQKEEKASKEEKKEQKEESKAARHDAKGQEHGQAGMEHAKPAGQSARIPDDKFRQHFGRQHTMVINRPVIVEGQPRFQSAGYWFVIEDPWPVDWAYTDDCYIDYIDGEYFLFDLLHPGVQVALFVVM